jgi:hypothetical protein
MAHIKTIAAVESSKGSGVKPEWIRPRQVTELFGIGRGTVQYLIVEKKIRSVSLCHDGLARGSRLISYASVCDYLEALAAEQQQQAAASVEEGGAA